MPPRILAQLVAAPAFLLFLIPSLFAQPETQHVFNFPWQVNERVEVTLHGRFRTRPGGEGLYQGRVGALLRTGLPKRVGLIAGYYFSEQEEITAQSDWEAWNRYFAGFDHRFLQWKGNWESRHLAEFFDAPGNANYYRVRHRAGWTAPTRVAPYASVEVFWDRDGWRSVRWQGGTLWRISARTSVDAHYFYEPRRLDVGPAARHMWGTTLQVRLGKLR